MPPPRTTAKLHFPVLQVDLFKRSGRPRSSERSRTILGPFIRGKIRRVLLVGRVLNKTRTFRINGTLRRVLF